MSKITKHQAIEKLRELVKIKGEDFQYTQVCRYSDSETGHYSCGVGYVLEELVPDYFKEIAGLEEETNTSCVVDYLDGTHINGYPSELATWPKLPATKAALRVLKRFQLAQDGGQYYSVALARAEEEYAK